MRTLLIAFLAALTASAQNYRGQIGIQIEDASEGSRSRAFVDLGRVFRAWAPASGSNPVPTDANGWPLTDAGTVIFDIRPVPAWAPPIDDPSAFQPDWSGVYSLSFQGQATVNTGDPGAVLSNQKWDAATNTTTAALTVSPSLGLLVLTFSNTQRAPGAATNTGITSLQVIRPGYPAGTGQIYTSEFLDSLAPFSVIRYMGFTSTNDADAKTYPAATNWSDRHVITDATQQETVGKVGFAWEYAILLANQTGKDMWINIPVSATEDYIRQLAALLQTRLNPGIKIYIEHSNEVWNPSFPQYNWNTLAATPEHLIDNLHRHISRLATISRIFGQVFGPGSINSRVCVIFAWWTIYPDQYDTALSWVQSTIGPPSSLFYGIAMTHYYNDQQASTSADVPGVLAAMRADSDNGVSWTRQLKTIAGRYGLRLTIYEGGPDNGGGSTTNIGNRILANRDPGMGTLVTHDIADNWFPLGGDLYMYFTESGTYSRYGCWGAVEDIANLNTPKYNALAQLIGPPPQPVSISAVANAASGAAEVAPGAFFSIYGANFTSLTSQWGEAILDGVTLPAALAGVRVRINGRDAYISYASPAQINAVGPPDTSTGPVTVEVITANGRASQTVPMTPVSPAFYGYTLNGVNYAWAIIATEPGTVFVAPTGGFGAAYSSRPAKAGDILSLFVNGLGGLGPDFPVGRALTQPYAIDKSALLVTIDGAPCAVSYAGAIYPGEYQVNVTVPALTRSADVPIVISTGGKSATSMLSVTTSR
jgi:uncharacterized protein (TIGR03437 family)